MSMAGRTRRLGHRARSPVLTKDCTIMDIPNDCIGYITGNRRAALGADNQT